MASNDVIWQLVKNSNCHLVKGLNNSFFSREKNNLASKHCFKYSGIANAKTVGIEAGEGEKGLAVKVSFTKAKASNTPVKASYSNNMTKDFRRQAKGVSKAVGVYRPDLKDMALRKLAAVNKSLRVSKAGVKTKKARK